jgi:prevent-host-death family protein
MAKVVNIHAAKTHFSKLVEEVEAGGEITVARAGKPILKLVKIEEVRTAPRKLGFLAKDLAFLDELYAPSVDAEFADLFDAEKFDYLEGK